MRDLTTDYKAAIAADAVRLGLICLIDYPDTPLRCWTGTGDLTWDSQTWLGIGALGNVSAVQERVGAQAGNVTASLAGVAEELRALALANASSSQLFKLWVAAFNEDAVTHVWSAVPDPWLVFQGITDVHKVLGGTISLSIETALSRLRQATIAHYTDADQKRRYPSDTGFRWATAIVTQPVYWGTAAPSGAQTTTPIDGGDGGNGGE